MIWVPAIVVLGLWFVIQFLNGALSLGRTVGGVAWFAHVGGFLAGIVLIFLFRRPKRRPARL